MLVLVDEVHVIDFWVSACEARLEHRFSVLLDPVVDVNHCQSVRRIPWSIEKDFDTSVCSEKDVDNTRSWTNDGGD